MERDSNYSWGSPTTYSRKDHVKKECYEEIYSIERPTTKQIKSPTTTVIFFGDDDKEGVQYSNDDALVVTMLIANCITRSILVDNNSSTDIIFWDAFNRMVIDPNRLRPIAMLLKGLSGDMVQLVGTITLSGKALNTVATMAEFLVVKAPSSYNNILGWLTLNNFRAITLTCHMKMKFPIVTGVGEVSKCSCGNVMYRN